MRAAASGDRRVRRAALLLAICALGAACGPDVVDEITPPAGTAPAQASESAPRDAASTPSPSDPVTGSFRRGGVPVPPDVLARSVAACKAVPASSDAGAIGDRPVVVSDLRGESVVLVVFAAADGATGCRATLREDGVEASLFAVATKTDGELDEGEITLGTYELDDDGLDQRMIAVGQLGERVVKVRAGFDDDTYVTSSTDNGW